jgi:V/A-type H+-transporting ATPase subunit K
MIGLELTAAFIDAMVLLQQGGPAITGTGLAALGVGLAGFGAGYAERGIGAAAIGALAEDSISFGIALVMTVLPETIVLLTLVTLFLQ